MHRFAGPCPCLRLGTSPLTPRYKAQQKPDSAAAGRGRPVTGRVDVQTACDRDVCESVTGSALYIQDVEASTIPLFGVPSCGMFLLTIQSATQAITASSGVVCSQQPKHV